MQGSRSDAFLGTTLKGTYRVDELVGEGGMGAVYAATHLRLGSRVAIKFLLLYRLRDEGVAEGVHRFRREARVAMELNDENIVHIHDYDVTPDETPYIVMEFLEGEDLDDLIQREAPLSLPRTMEILRQITSALTAAHRREVVHRDLKPGNIFLKRRATGETVVKVVDFGIAKLLGSSSLKTRPNSVMGTPHFMAPEQARTDDHQVDARADIFSLGCILYYMLCKRMPFAGTKYSQVLLNLMMSDPRPPREVRPELPEAVERVILKALSRDRQERYATARDLARAFEVAIRGAAAAEYSATLSGPTPALSGEVGFGEADLSPTRMSTMAVGDAPTIPPDSGPRSALTETYTSPTGLDTVVTGEEPTLPGGLATLEELDRPPEPTPPRVDEDDAPDHDQVPEEDLAATVLDEAPVPVVEDAVEPAQPSGEARRSFPVAAAALALVLVAGGIWFIHQGASRRSTPDAGRAPVDHARDVVRIAPDSAVVPDASPDARQAASDAQAPDRRRAAPRRGLLNVVPRVAGGTVSATVYLDGRKLGEAPRQFRVQPGKHMLRISRAGYPPVLKEIRLRPGQRKKVIVQMER